MISNLGIIFIPRSGFTKRNDGTPPEFRFKEMYFNSNDEIPPGFII
jgi:hypothetical protein